MKFHELKTFKTYFQDIQDGVKKFEVRLNDRGFKVGDALHLREFDGVSQTYTGREIHRRVTYILDDPRFVKDGFIVMGIK